jgi:hypothetical protein
MYASMYVCVVYINIYMPCLKKYQIFDALQGDDNVHKLMGNATPKELPEIVNKVLQGHASNSRVGMGELAMRVAGFQNRLAECVCVCVCV